MKTPACHPRRRLAAASTSLSAIGLLLAGCGTNGSTSSTTSTTRPSTTSATSSSTTTTTAKQSAGSAAEALQQAFVAVVAKVRPQVVQISTATGLGSGVVYDRIGDVVTNAHVVGTETSFTIQLVTGQQMSATLVGRYVPDDLAVIRVSRATGLSPATFGDSNSLQVGDIVFAVGNPLGLSSSVTEGIVSYNGRSVSEGNGVVLPSTIQTSAPINPGNSGGALVDLAGEVVGIPTLAAADSQSGGAAAGIGFAIPSTTVKMIASQLIATGEVTHSGRAALGISAVDAVTQMGQPVGAAITVVGAGGSAEKAGITAGDVITSIAGKPVTSVADLQTVLAQLTPGKKVSVDLLDQSGNRRTVNVVLDQLQG